MRVVIAGGSGFIGRKLISELLQHLHEVILLSRAPERTKKIFPAARIEFWDTKTKDRLEAIFDGIDAVINLTGEPIAKKRWTDKQKQEILISRIDSTRVIVAAIKQLDRKPSVLLNASAVGYYGDVPEGEVTEAHPKGNGFLADVCEQWEGEALDLLKFNVRVVLLRTGIVLDKNGGALHKFLLPFRFFAGGPLGSGKQWFPWIHLDDEVNAILFAMENSQISGPLNLSAPESVRIVDFCRALGRIIHRPSWLPVPSVVLKLALGEMAEPLLLHSQHVVPKKLIDAGFNFKFPDLSNALADILSQ
jgi:uncharacterized protein (TIGR01777 family)